jgi:hypothetical protein
VRILQHQHWLMEKGGRRVSRYYAPYGDHVSKTRSLFEGVDGVARPSQRVDRFEGGVAVGVSGATAEAGLEGVYLRGEAGDPGLIGAVGQAVTAYQLSANICARLRRPGRKR